MEQLSDADYSTFKESNPQDTVHIKTANGNEYQIRLTEKKGATWFGIGVQNEAPVIFELRGGRGVDGNNDRPYIALGIGGKNSVVETEKTEGVTHIEGFGHVKIHRESGRISYDEEVISFENEGSFEVKLG